MNNVAQVNGWTQFACVQVEHSLLYRTEVSSQLLSQLTSLCSRTNASDFAQELELFSYCNYKGIGIIGFSPLMDGHLARPIGTDLTFEICQWLPLRKEAPGVRPEDYQTGSRACTEAFLDNVSGCPYLEPY